MSKPTPSPTHGPAAPAATPVPLEVLSVRQLVFDDGGPVSAASGVAPLGDGHLVACDDATHAAWVTPRGVAAVRLFAPVAGHDRFSPVAGTKRLKPDLDAAVAVSHGGLDGVLLLGSGSKPVRMRSALVLLRAPWPQNGPSPATTLPNQPAAEHYPAGSTPTTTSDSTPTLAATHPSPA